MKVMYTEKKININIDYTYIEEVFESKEEYKYFLQIMCFEFEEAINKLTEAIEKHDGHSFRKTMHNVGSHLEMLRANELSHFLKEIKPQVENVGFAGESKEQLIQQIDHAFKDVIQHVKSKCEGLSEAS